VAQVSVSVITGVLRGPVVDGSLNLRIVRIAARLVLGSPVDAFVARLRVPRVMHGILAGVPDEIHRDLLDDVAVVVVDLELRRDVPDVVVEHHGLRLMRGSEGHRTRDVVAVVPHRRVHVDVDVVRRLGVAGAVGRRVVRVHVRLPLVAAVEVVEVRVPELLIRRAVLLAAGDRGGCQSRSEDDTEGDADDFDHARSFRNETLPWESERKSSCGSPCLEANMPASTEARILNELLSIHQFGQFVKV